MISEETRQKHKQTRAENRAYKEAEAQRYPGACINSHGVSLCLSPGAASYLEIERAGPHAPFKAEMWLDDINQLAQFVRALTARLNARIEEANEHLAQCGVRKLNTAREGSDV